MNVSAVPVDQLSDGLRALWAAAPKEGQRRMIRVTAHASEHAELYWPFYNCLRFANSLGPRLNELIRVMAASTTECNVCLGSNRDTSIDAQNLTKDQLIALRDADDEYTEAELAVMSFTYKLGTNHLSIGQDDFATLHQHFTEREIVEIGLLASQFIGVGRLSAVLKLEDLVCVLKADGQSRTR